MALTTTVAGAQAKAADIDQFRQLLKGIMSGEPIVNLSTITGTALIASGLTGATSAGRWVGVTASGAPVSGTFIAGDWITTLDGRMWVCTTGGTPGTWQQPSPPPDTVAGDIVALAAASAAGSVGKSADAGHVHPWTGLGVLSVAGTWTADQNFGTHLIGTQQTAAQPNITSLGAQLILMLAGVTGAPNQWRLGGALTAQAQGVQAVAPASGTWSTGDLVADLKAFLWMCRAGGTPGTWNVIPRGWGVEPQTIFTAVTRSDVDAVTGDLLVNA
jgi:hypothetical protein